MSNEIDIVITWVDGNDPVWQDEKAKYITVSDTQKKDVAGKDRYQDNGLLRYLFRGIEKFASWVHKVYFVTYGHLPVWLNTEFEKLVIVNHKDFMPEDCLPTFSSVPLNLNLHRIPGLSEQFIYFNDDMYLVSPTSPDLFFKSGLPRDMAVQDVIPATESTTYWHMVFNDIIMLNANVNKKECLRNNPRKWINTIYGKNMIKNILLSPISMFTGIYETHLPASYLKSVYEKVWEDNTDALLEVSHHKVRTQGDISENFIRYYQMATGKFFPINKLKYGRYCSMRTSLLPQFISSGKYKYLCINDNADDVTIGKIKDAFDNILPEKSSFEIMESEKKAVD